MREAKSVQTIRVIIEDPVTINKFTPIQKQRGHKKPGRTLRELALERAKQIADFGDVPMAPLRQQAAVA